MRYICLIYRDEAHLRALSQSEADGVMEAYYDFTDWVKRSGHYLASDPLQPTTTATTVRVREGRRMVTDGPFSETKEQLGGYFLIEAADLDDAIEVAARIPGARTGSVEVRPVLEIPPREGSPGTSHLPEESRA